MPFGKYEGCQLRDLPTDYLEWLTTLEKLRTRLAEAVRAELERRTIPRPSVEIIRELVSLGRKSAAKRYHPDAGENADAVRMAALNAAADWILIELT
jgi:hypothetical protein